MKVNLIFTYKKKSAPPKTHWPNSEATLNESFQSLRPYRTLPFPFRSSTNDGRVRVAGRHILPIPVHASSFRRHARCFRILLINQYTRPRNRNGRQKERRRFHRPADAPLVSARREALLNATHTSHQQTPFVQRARRPSVPCRAETRVYTLPRAHQRKK